MTRILFVVGMFFVLTACSSHPKDVVVADGGVDSGDDGGGGGGGDADTDTDTDTDTDEDAGVDASPEVDADVEPECLKHIDCPSCQICDSYGKCVNEDYGRDYKDDCAGVDPNACGFTGDCDGKGACEYWDGDENDFTCNDGNACTIKDHCEGSMGCVGIEVACKDDDGCCPTGCGVANDSDCPCADLMDVRQPETKICWNRCPLGQTFNEGCYGDLSMKNWTEAMGACPKGYTLPTKGQYEALLGGAPCEGDSTCALMFGTDTGMYWTSSFEGETSRYFVAMSDGAVHQSPYTNDYAVRCLTVIEE